MTTHASHQTVRLSQGKHRDPDHGACVMELASMLAAEPFSDRPRCVDPVIAGFLRTYNDGIDDRRRQDLYPLAAEVVGSRSVSSVQAERAQMCLRWAQDRYDARRRGARRLLPLRPLLPDGRLGCVIGDVAGVVESPAYAIFAMNKTLQKLDSREFGGGGSAIAVYNASQPFTDAKPALKWDGEWHITIEVFRDLGTAFAACLVLIYVLMVGWFRSFLTPMMKHLGLVLRWRGMPQKASKRILFVPRAGNAAGSNPRDPTQGWKALPESGKRNCIVLRNIWVFRR